MGTAKNIFTAGAVGLALAWASTAVSAAPITLDIIQYIDTDDGVDPAGGAGEQAVTGNLSIQGVIVEAYGTAGGTKPTSPSYPTGTSDAYAYLDGGGAGMGVCSGGITSPGSQCSSASDDNVGYGVTGGSPGSVTEILSIGFLENWDIDELLFRNEGHTPVFGSGKEIDVAVDGVNLGNGVGAFKSFTLEVLASGSTDLGASLLGFSIANLAADAFIHLKNNNQQFYLSGIVLDSPSGNITTIPLPASLVFLLSGLLGLGALGRVHRKNA